MSADEFQRVRLSDELFQGAFVDPSSRGIAASRHIGNLRSVWKKVQLSSYGIAMS
jgi:hypothetical protein